MNVITHFQWLHIPAACRRHWHQHCSSHHDTLSPTGHWCTPPLYPHTDWSLPPGEHLHTYSFHWQLLHIYSKNAYKLYYKWKVAAPLLQTLTSYSSILWVATADNRTSRTVNQVVLTASAANIVQVDCTSTSTKVSMAECHCICLNKYICHYECGLRLQEWISTYFEEFKTQVQWTHS